MQPEVNAFFDTNTNTVTYVVADPATNTCVVIDPVLDFDPAAALTTTKSADEVIEFVKRNELRCEWILETDVHADYLLAAPHIRRELGGKIAIGDHIAATQDVFGDIFNAGPEFARDGSQFDHLFHEGDEFKVGKISARVIHTPGHTPACVTYVIGDAAFVGDTLFMPDYGTARADFPGGDARALYRSIQKIFALEGDTRLFMCHDYLPDGRDQHQWQTTVDQQKQSNIHIHDGVSEDEFVKMREARDAELGMPKLILPSIQVNIRAGRMPDPESNGTVYLKLPMNTLGEPDAALNNAVPRTQ